MKTKPLFRIFIILLLLISNIGCDQISKNIIREKITYNARHEFISGHVILTKIENSGAMLSLGSSLPESIKFILLTIFPVIVLTLAIVFLVTNDLGKISTVAICFVVGGGMGNIYDRIMYGSVTDFLHIDFGLFRTGIFNMADVSIMMGIGIVLFESYIRQRRAV